jgi:hypothetical protein
MYQPINQVRLRGFLTEPARLFVSRSGQPRIAFRMEVWIDDENLHRKSRLVSITSPWCLSEQNPLTYCHS